MSWQYLCDVDVAPLLEWLEVNPQRWSQPASDSKPQRVFSLPAGLFEPIAHVCLSRIPGKSQLQLIPHQAMLSRMQPGQRHGLHHDAQRADWLTRIHVPLVTNPDAWIYFEGERPVNFEVGCAYTFDTYRRHAFGNDGKTDRVHLIFDVLIQHGEDA